MFVDVLTTPPGAWALVVCAGVLGSASTFSGRRLAGRGALVATAWIIGWVWTWVAKWVIAAVVLGVDVVRDSVSGAIDDRIAGERSYIDLAPFNSIRLNVETWLDHPLTPVVLVAIAVGTALTWRHAAHRSVWRTRLIIAAPAVLPLLWFEVLRNHSLVHVLFVYRSLGATAGIVAVALLVAPSSLRTSDAESPDTAAPAPSDHAAR